jgi:hypothetical protein
MTLKPSLSTAAAILRARARTHTHARASYRMMRRGKSCHMQRVLRLNVLQRTGLLVHIKECAGSCVGLL